MKYTVVLTNVEDTHQTLSCEIEGDFLPRKDEILRIDAMVFVKIDNVRHEIHFDHESKTSKATFVVVGGEITAKEFEYLEQTNDALKYRVWIFYDDSHLED